LPDISQIKQKRMELGITQKGLARLSGVGQPVISKIETSKIPSPSYDCIKKIFQAFNNIEPRSVEKNPVMKRPVVASDIMHTNVIAVAPDTLVQEAWSIMKSNSFSQLPVIDRLHRVVGKITESSLLAEAKEAADMVDKRVKNVMGDPFPVLGVNTPVTVLAALLKNMPAILVADRGEITGIITRYDLIEYLYGFADLK
jgi:predicted transcriptional regulator